MSGHEESPSNQDAPSGQSVATAVEGLQDVLADWAARRDPHDVTPGAPSGLPVRPAVGSVVDGRLDALRRFHAGQPEGEVVLETPGDGFLPALLRPFRDARRLRHDYPLFLSAVASDDDRRPAVPVSELLHELTDLVGGGPSGARILRDNLARLERQIGESLDGSWQGADAASVVAAAAAATEAALALRGDSGAAFHDELEKLVALVPPDGSLMALGARTPLLLFLHVAGRHAAQRASTLRSEIERLRNRLVDLMRLDDSRHAGTDRPQALAASLGAGAGPYVDPEALARIVGTTRGAAPMTPERHRRVNDVVDVLDRHLQAEDGPFVHVVQAEAPEQPLRRPGVAWRDASSGGVCREASNLFDAVAAGFTELFGAMRLARLELDNAYDPARHDDLRASFDWRSFTASELRSLPLVLAVESADTLVGPDMLALSDLLRSGRPVNVVVAVEPATSPGAGAPDEQLMQFRFELGYLGISHREALVNQTTAARPGHMLAGFQRGVEASRAALHVVACGLPADRDDPGPGTWLHGGAALEGRAHPLFHYDPESGETWARRLDFAGNPQPEADWPVYTLPCARPDGERADLSIAFTFADFALMEPRYRHHFRIVPDDVAEESLVGVDEFMTLLPADAEQRIPCIWAVDEGNRLHRLAVSRHLVFACRDRLAYWHTLQELAGVRNEYVREAVEAQRERLEAEEAERRDALAAEHAVELERVRTEAAGDAMRRLAEALLATDVASLAAPPTAAPSTAAPPPAAPAPPPTPASEELETEPEIAAEEAPVAEEPWIDTALCTSCNDCLDINPRLFVYDGNKQAVIGDPRAGTYDELVRAAEKCPARCIHPGTPLNPEEPNLEELIERAKPFNV
jgi:ferredoxin